MVAKKIANAQNNVYNIYIMDDKLKSIYYNVENGGLCSANTLYNKVKNDTEYKYTLKYLKEWIANQEGHQILRNVPKVTSLIYPPIMSETSISNDYQCDLMFINFKKQNAGHNTILNFI